uniref:atherin-like n=1 Tax=Podarcis muralis TaxID=64176 RepID=UPI00109F4A5D|nr:atherin-like [Podarcis muralis]
MKDQGCSLGPLCTCRRHVHRSPTRPPPNKLTPSTWETGGREATRPAQPWGERRAAQTLSAPRAVPKAPARGRPPPELPAPPRRLLPRSLARGAPGSRANRPSALQQAKEPWGAFVSVQGMLPAGLGVAAAGAAAGGGGACPGRVWPEGAEEGGVEEEEAAAAAAAPETHKAAAPELDVAWCVAERPDVEVISILP